MNKTRPASSDIATASGNPFGKCWGDTPGRTTAYHMLAVRAGVPLDAAMQFTDDMLTHARRLVDLMEQTDAFAMNNELCEQLSALAFLLDSAIAGSSAAYEAVTSAARDTGPGDGAG